ncbi:allantoin permease [Streptomyces spiroverticillatus]|uniref:Allantoin permease n=1 Tax=Streptomyces finlayi TaxID=67296 RepID=A0A918WYL2_9ACTN|nr:cytosine permease [Streptomyces finlayi]GHA15681.1 allantoin permease [Streptomyces spiroverticillatus]GHC96588.1 allantoin permease [Streptomyces finlayi]
MAEAPAPGAPSASSAFTVEQRGIDAVPTAERHGKPIRLLWLWAGTNTTVFTVVYGALVVSFGLSFVQAVALIVIGNLLGFAVTGLTSLQGPATGTSTHSVSRASFGPRGGRLPALFGWITLVGFEAGGMVLIALAGIALLDQAGIEASATVKILVILAAAALQMLLPMAGYHLIMQAQKYFAYVFAAMFAVMAILVAPKVEPGAPAAESPTLATISLVLALVTASGGLSWASMGSDYSRYLPADSSKKKVFACAALGGMVPNILLQILGAAVATVTVNASDPISGLPEVLPGWFVVPYLLLAVVTLLAVNTTDMYSSGLNLLAAGIRIKRSAVVWIDLSLCTGITVWAVFSDSFYSLLSQFLSLVVLWLGPWAAVYLVDWALRRGRYDVPSLFPDETGAKGLYWGRGGIRPQAVLAFALGVLAAVLWLNSEAFQGPLSKAANGLDLSVFAGALVAGVAYWLLAAKDVRTEAAALAPVHETV